MKTDLILVEQFCLHHNIDVTFITALQDFGLVEVVIVEDRTYLPQEQLLAVEKMMRLHYELEINLQGIDAIGHLLQRIEALQQELTTTRNKLMSFGNRE